MPSGVSSVIGVVVFVVLVESVGVVVELVVVVVVVLVSVEFFAGEVESVYGSEIVLFVDVVLVEPGVVVVCVLTSTVGVCVVSVTGTVVLVTGEVYSYSDNCSDDVVVVPFVYFVGSASVLFSSMVYSFVDLLANSGHSHLSKQPVDG